MLWIKALHIVFVASWFAGLFYLPRIFVNLAMVAPESVAEHERLLLMARKLLRFTTLLAGPAVGLGLWLWLGYGIGWGPRQWLDARQAVRWCCWCWATTMPARRPAAQIRSHLRQPAQPRLVPLVQRGAGADAVAAVVLVVVKPF
jgi:putative membrane protein